MKIQRKQTSENQTSDVNYQKGNRSEILDHNRCKKIKRKHVEKQMSKVSMKKRRSNHPDVLTGTNTSNMEFVFSEKGYIIKTFVAY